MQPYRLVSVAIAFLSMSLPACAPESQTERSLLLLASPTIPACSLDDIRNSIPSEPTPSPIPTSDSREIEWATYTNSEYGFSFEYPAQYTSNQVPTCAPRGLQHSKGAGIELYVGSSTAIFVWKLQDPTWQDYACRMLKINEGRWELTSLQDITINDVTALEARYSSQETSAGITVFAGLADNTLTITLGSNTSCDIPRSGIDGLVVFSHVIDSFRLGAQ